MLSVSGLSTSLVYLALGILGPNAGARAGAQFKEYLERAEYIKGVIDGQQPAEVAPANGATGQKARPPGSGGGADVRPSLP